ncbi:SDR family oxidoreductase [Pelistega europaea]|uniref:SDR family oxidoreductase n=1 Tax=Pelistega europaea TaxID=106147 RepID=A0A7Y4L8V4_9BURK|nr:SDR family oxidoreductase [Pelistega europaea]NOL49038.1 SDR family oxidoreductase [Pelistega europaea]
MKIAVTGATGQLGRFIVEKLKAKIGADSVTALARRPEVAKGLGVEVRLADYDCPETLDAALQGVDKLMLVSSSEVGKREQQHRHAVNASKKNGIQHIVYTSIIRADQSSLVVAKEHPATEKDIKDSLIPYTILRNDWYHENYTASVPAAMANGAFYGCAGDAKISSAAREDYADAAVAVLLDEGHENRVYELAGDGAYTLTELAAEISRQTGKSIPYVDLTEDDYAAALVKAGFSDFMARLFAGFDTSAKRGDLFCESKQLSQLIGRPTTPIAVSVAKALKTQ